MFVKSIVKKNKNKKKSALKNQFKLLSLSFFFLTFSSVSLSQGNCNGDVQNPKWFGDKNTLYSPCEQVKVGIGTDNPQRNLHLKGITCVGCPIIPVPSDPPVKFTTYLRMEDERVNSSGQTLSNSRWDLGVTAAQNRFFITRPGFGIQSPLSIVENGSVGIGVNQPQAKLDVAGPIRFLASNSQTSYITGNNSPHIYSAATVFPGGADTTMFGSLVLQSRSNGNRPIIFVTGQNPQERMRVSRTGNVGIGVENPTNRLEVCGTIRSTEWIVETGWCDFVFEENYNKMNWKIKQNYYVENGHLPYIDSGVEIEQYGLRSHNLKGMMWNIEENRLDITELFEENVELKEENNELKIRLLELEERMNNHEKENNIKSISK